MAVNPSEMRVSAQGINVASGNEADFRSCISRFYYAGFHTAKNFHQSLSAPGTASAKGGSHEMLIHQLKHPNISPSADDYLTSKEIAEYMKKALFNRRLADYRLDESVTLKNVEVIENDVKLIFDAV